MKTTRTMLVIVLCLLQACSYYEMKEETEAREKKWSPPPVEYVNTESTCQQTHSYETPFYSEDPFHHTQPSSEFTIDANNDNLIAGKSGTRVFLPANCFNVAKGKRVKITLREFTNERELFLSQLTTVSNEKPLISGGTIQITATCDGKEVSLKKDGALTVLFRKPAGNTDDMLAFYGRRTAGGTMNWPTYTPSWKESFCETGFHETAQERQDTLYPEIKKIRDSLMAGMLLSEDQRAWLYQESKRERNPKFFLRKVNNGLYMLDKKSFCYNFASADLQKFALVFFQHLIHDSITKKVNETVSFSPAIERKPFYEGEKEWINSLVKSAKGDTTNARAYIAQMALTNYILRATEMGFINCDRFYNYSNANQEVLVNLPERFKGKVQMMIPAVNGVYEARKKDDNTWAFTGLPKGLPFTVIAFTPVNGKISAFVEKGKTGNYTFENPTFKKYPCEEFVALVQNTSRPKR
ncbi:MAG: hypothetical protein ACHQF2_00990 [Flavobacteriales bacterium]